MSRTLGFRVCGVALVAIGIYAQLALDKALAPQFAVLLSIIFLVEVAAAIAGYVFKDKARSVLEEGLWDAMRKGRPSRWMKKNILIVAAVALGIAFFEILGIIFACCLMKGIRSGYEVM
ncbi:CD63 molecule [Columba livia]|uniref:CD63 molecule n=1 Tax=Columba livia TaxID=8932 RepID=A0A2I0LJA3_COLLI|nr:CD63 molecule [Columba livia]